LTGKIRHRALAAVSAVADPVDGRPLRWVTWAVAHGRGAGQKLSRASTAGRVMSLWHLRLAVYVVGQREKLLAFRNHFAIDHQPVTTFVLKQSSRRRRKVKQIAGLNDCITMIGI
jgi:hypothetical protein